jgi:adenylate cyclase
VVFADGLGEELVTTLGVFSDVFRIVHSAEPGETGEGYEIVGQVRNGDRLRITCHLVDRATGNRLWADRFDFGNDASYDAQERIAVAVITALQLKLTDGETARLWSNRSTSLAAWEQFHRARMCEARYTSDSNSRSKMHFAKAMELDPDFVPAVVGLGFSYLDAVRLGWSHDQHQDLEKALYFAELALGKDGNDPYAIALLAYVERAQGKLEQSVATMARAVGIAPRNGELVAYYANMLWMQGNWSAAVSQNRRALDLTPQPSSWIQANLGLALLWDDQPAEAQRVFETVIKGDPDYIRAYIGLAVALFRQGRTNEAKKIYRELVVMDPGFQPEGWLARNLNFNPKESEQFMSDLLAASR